MQYSLYLYPSNDYRDYSVQELTDFLSDLQLVKTGFDNRTLMPGEKLMQYITYLGCSPSLNNDHSENKVLLYYFKKIKGLGGNSIDRLRFPRCKHTITNPQALLSSTPSTQWRCTECDNSGYVSEINWRKSAAFANLFIEISSIFPKEAIPSQNFIELLNEFSSSEWRWFYSSSSTPQDPAL